MTASEFYFDAGPCWQAAHTLATASTLDQHVIVNDINRHIMLDPDDVPVTMWGDATQLLWKLMASIAGDRPELSLRELAGRCDPENKVAVTVAIAELMGGA